METADGTSLDKGLKTWPRLKGRQSFCLTLPCSTPLALSYHRAHKRKCRIEGQRRLEWHMVNLFIVYSMALSHSYKAVMQTMF